MLFNSYEYLLFFPTVVLIYFLLPYNRRWILLLIASYYFYMSWNPTYILLILASTLIDYFAALRMSRHKTKNRRKKYLWLSLASNLGILFSFKYFNFFNDSVKGLADFVGWNYPIEALAVLLPVGISFYTFQTLSYTIDVYNRKIKPERHLGIFALFVSFFPQLVAGPIERPANLIPQFRQRFDYIHTRVVSGLTLIMWGLFKKVVIADRLATIVNPIYNDIEAYTGLPLIMATVFFAFQIYCDFSGYSDIAIGSARVMGFDLMKNFDRPYFSKSIAEFWKRWHISLSTWFRDYVYIPLGGNRTVKWRWYYNLFITFTVSGLWHGAAWTFVIWGMLHGAYLIISIVSQSHRDSIKNFLRFPTKGLLNKLWQASIVFILVGVGWVFFRANSLDDATYVLTQFDDGIRSQLANISFARLANLLDTNKYELAYAFFFIGIMELVHLWERKREFSDQLARLPTLLRWPIYYFFVLAIIFFGVFGENEFIYFQF